MALDTLDLTSSVSPSESRLFSLSNPKTWFYAIASFHVTLWTLMPALLRSGLPMDALEGYIWGQQLELGYDRNPWLNAWLTRLAMEFSAPSGWLTYFLSQCCVILAFWSVWQFGKRWLTAWHAIIAILLLETLQYYSLAAIDFNDNVLELALWPAFAWFGYSAITSQKTKAWMLTAITGSLALMAKYYSALMLIPFFLFLCLDSKARESFKRPVFYGAVLLFMGISLPHFIWLAGHHFVTLQYALNRVGDNANMNLWHWVKPALRFFVVQISNLIPAVLILLSSLCFRVKNQAEVISAPALTVSSKKYLYLMALGPLFLTVFLALVSGWQLHVLWGTPLLSLWGLIFVSRLKLTLKRIRYLMTVLFAVMLIYMLGYFMAMRNPNNQSTGNYPGAAIAQDVEKIWVSRFHQPLEFVAGDRYLSGYVSLYASSHPSVYLEWDPERSFWIDEKKLREKGGVFVQNIKDGEKFPAKILQDFPQLIILPLHEYLRPHQTDKNKPIKILVGLLPPHH
jgi:4-amino-4-deoxy-L-arabinose transferase-like glycosyltransferase